MDNVLQALILNMDLILDRMSVSKLNQYAHTQNYLHLVDVSTDPDYRRIYIDFYGLRNRMEIAHDLYFQMLKELKNEQSIQIRPILIKLQAATNTIQTSFASKLIATIDPNIPPLDSVVRRHFGLNLPIDNAQNRMDGCIATYNQLVAFTNEIIANNNFEQLRIGFNQHFPDYNFTDMKILGLFLWRAPHGLI